MFVVDEARASPRHLAGSERRLGVLEGGVDGPGQPDEERLLGLGGAAGSTSRMAAISKRRRGSWWRKKSGTAPPRSRRAHRRRSDPARPRRPARARAWPPADLARRAPGCSTQRRSRPPRRDGVLEQLGQELLVGGRGAVLAEQPGARLDELADLEGGAAVALVDARAERDPLAVERAVQPLRERPSARRAPASRVARGRPRRRRGAAARNRPGPTARWRA